MQIQTLSLLTTLTLLHLPSVIADATPKSYDQLVKQLPTCAQSCFNDIYDDIFGNQCGDDARKSTKKEDVHCICTATESSKEHTANSRHLRSCLESACADVSMADARKASHALSGLFDMCEGSLGGDDISSSTGTGTGEDASASASASASGSAGVIPNPSASGSASASVGASSTSASTSSSSGSGSSDNSGGSTSGTSTSSASASASASSGKSGDSGSMFSSPCLK